MATASTTVGLLSYAPDFHLRPDTATPPSLPSSLSTARLLQRRSAVSAALGSDAATPGVLLLSYGNCCLGQPSPASLAPSLELMLLRSSLPASNTEASAASNSPPHAHSRCRRCSLMVADVQPLLGSQPLLRSQPLPRRWSASPETNPNSPDSLRTDTAQPRTTPISHRAASKRPEPNPNNPEAKFI